MGWLRRQARFARRMHVGKIKYRGQHRAEDRANTLDCGGGAEHMTSTLDRGGSAEHMADILRRSDHAEDLRVRNGRGRSLSLGRRGKAFSYGTGAGGGSHLADQEASGKVFAYGMGAGGRSHLGAGARLARTAQVPEVARTWSTRRRRARARLSRTAQAREVARTWPSYEMIHDTVTVH